MKRSSKTRGASAKRARPASAARGESPWARWLVRVPGERRYWLVKSEPEAFSFDDLMRAPGRTTGWDGVRNHVARNFLRHGMKVGDRVLFYHSNADPPSAVGICEVAREGYPDPTALDPRHDHFDPASDPDEPTWYQVDVQAVEALGRPVGLGELRARKELANMAMLRIGRLSVTPVSDSEWHIIMEMGSTES